MWQTIALALARQIGGDRAAADAALKNLIDRDSNGSAYQIAEVYALRRDPDNLFKWLDRAWVNRDPGIQFLLHPTLPLKEAFQSFNIADGSATACSTSGVRQPQATPQMKNPSATIATTSRSQPNVM